MIVIMTLLARDEADVVAATIEHHIAAGIDFIVATDNGSSDGTQKILRSYEVAGVLELHHEPAHVFRQAEWVTRMARRAVTAFRADWVINIDADEFVWPPDQIRACLAGTASSSLLVARDNLVADPGATGNWPERLTIRDTCSLTPRGRRIGPKLIHIGDPEVTVGPGNHSARGPRVTSQSGEHPLRILHVPVRDADQYRRKIENGATAVQANADLDPEICWHWRDAHQQFENGASLHEQPTTEDVSRLLTSGQYQRDTRLRDRLRELADSALREEEFGKIVRRD